MVSSSVFSYKLQLETAKLGLNDVILVICKEKNGDHYSKVMDMKLLTQSEEASAGFLSPKLVQNLDLSSKTAITEWLMELFWNMKDIQRGR